MSSSTQPQAPTAPPGVFARLLGRPALLAMLLATLGGALCGEAGWWALVSIQAESTPPGWTLEDPRVPYQLTDLAGTLGHRPGAWSVGHWRGFHPDPQARSRGDRLLALTIEVPAGGQAEILLSPAGGMDSATLLLERVGAPSTRLLVKRGSVQSELSCAADLQPPGDAPVELEIRPLLRDLEIRLGATSVTCDLGFPPPWEPTLRPGLLRIHISSLALDGASASPELPLARPLAWALGAAAALLLALLELASGARASLVALTSLPLLAAGLLAGREPALWAETVRATWLPVRWLPLLAPSLLGMGAKATHHLGRALQGLPWATGPWSLRAWIATGLWLAAVAALSAALGGPGPGALAWAVALGAAWSLLVWANANAACLRWYNTICLLASAALLVGAEGWLRHTPADHAWDASVALPGASDIMGSLIMAKDDFASIDQAEHTTYPDRGYPVAIAAADGRPRLVAMGGSTTGGAWQNDDLDEFYPARLAAYIGPSLQVLNQGVGGWTTWHIRHYLAQGAFERLQPDILVLYVGHNDLLTPAPVPYAQLYARWLEGGALAASSSILNRSRLYQGLRYAVVGLRPHDQRVAVPVEHARENLAWIAGKVTDRGGRVILVSEGLAPDPAPMDAYNAMLAQLAATTSGVSYVDGADALHTQPGSQVFLDDCHLSQVGHDLLARLLVAELEVQGLLVDPPADLPPAINSSSQRRRELIPGLGPPGPGKVTGQGPGQGPRPEGP